MLESDAVAVKIDSHGGGFIVKDKRTGRKWGTVSDGAKSVPPVLTDVACDGENLRGKIAEWKCRIIGREGTVPM